MPGNGEEILKEIENLRRELERVALEKGVAGQEVLDLSRKLDVALNVFYRVLPASSKKWAMAGTRASANK